jgi:hypothetical protein
MNGKKDGRFNKPAYRSNAVALWIVIYAIEHRGNTPTVLQIAEHFGLSVSSAQQCIDYLYKHGIAERIDGNLEMVGSGYLPPQWYIDNIDPPKSEVNHTETSRRNKRPVVDPI